MNIPRKTKILCTIGPATDTVDKLVKLIENGMDVARLNFSHGGHDYHKTLIENIRKASEITGKALPILQDLQGPKIRTGEVENGGVELTDGQKFVITTDDIETGTSERVSTSYKDLVKDLRKNRILLLDDGYIILHIDDISGKDIMTTVKKGGILKNNKGIIAPGLSFSAPSISDKDREDLKFGLEHGIDVVALSFVRSVVDLYELKTTMKIFGRVAPIVAKIERPEAIDHIDEIIEEAHSIMVARGDLGLELPPEQVPIVQKELVNKCNFHGKPVITATQMLESMIQNPRPTRAEASDVANAVIDGSDCVMLSGETSVGKYPMEAVEYMDKIVKEVEKEYYGKNSQFKINQHPTEEVSDAMGRASCVIAEQINAAAIVTETSSTFTAKNIAKYRPKIPIIGITADPSIQRRLNFVWGVESILIHNGGLGDNLENLSECLLKKNYINKDDYVVYIAGLSRSGYLPENIIKVIVV